MPTPTISRNQYADPARPGAIPPHAGSHHERDMADFHLPLARLHHAALHGWGVAAGLEVRGAPGASELVVAPGVAVDAEGRLIVLADGGRATLGADSWALDEVAAPVTLSLAGWRDIAMYVTIQFHEVPRPAAGDDLPRWEQAPWLRLLPISGSLPPEIGAGTALVLAIVGIDAQGAVAGLQAADSTLPYRRRPLGQAVGELRLRRARAEGDTIAEATAGTLGAGPAGGLLLAVAAQTDTIVLAHERGGGFAGLAVQAPVAIQGDLRVSGATALQGLSVSGDISLTGTVDGRDIGADGAWLDTHLAAANPHGVTAQQVGAPVSLKGVRNPGGDIDLVSDSEAISITADAAGRRITIAEGHSARRDNPHGVTAEMIEAVSRAGDTITGPLVITVGMVSAPGLQITTGQDAGPTSGGFLVLGRTDDANLALDNNEIMARRSGAAAPLYLQSDGGDLAVHANTFTQGSGRIGSNGAQVSGDSGARFVDELALGDTIRVQRGVQDEDRRIRQIIDQSHLVLERAFSTDLLGGAPFFYRRQQPFVVKDGGNVGVGTIEPQARLHLERGDLVIDALHGYQPAGEAAPSLRRYPDGWGKWMQLGAMRSEAGFGWNLGDAFGLHVQHESDYAFFGSRREGADRVDAVIAWGDNSTDPRDSLRFLFGQANSAAPREHLRITADGKVGIGTPEPQRPLHVKGGAALLALEGSDHAYIEWYPDGHAAGRKAWLGFGGANDHNLTLCNQIPGAHILLRPSGGNVGVGTLAPSARLSVHADERNVPALAISSSQSNGSTGMIFVSLPEPGDEAHRIITSRRRNPAKSAWQDWTIEMGGGDAPVLQVFRAFRPDTQRPQFETPLALAWNGRVGVGTSSPQFARLMIEDQAVPLSFRETDHDLAAGGLWRMPLDGGVLRFDVNTGAAGKEFSTDNFRKVLLIHPDGRVEIPESLFVKGARVSSDLRRKDAVAPIGDALAIVRRLRGVSFRWKDDPGGAAAPRRHLGLIAQELEQVIPEVVSTDDEGYKFVEYDAIIPVLIEALKAQQQQIAELRPPR